MRPTKSPENRADMPKQYVRVHPRVRAQFKMIAHLQGDTIEERIERLMRQDIERNRELLTTSSL